MLEFGAGDFHSKDKHFSRTPLLSAVSRGHYAVVKLLLEHDVVNFNVKDKYRNTPLSLARLRGYKAAFKLLLE